MNDLDFILWIRSRWSALLGALVLSMSASAIYAEPGEPPRGREPAALSSLQPGLWSLRGLDATSPSKSLCVVDLRMLLQIAHPKGICPRSVIIDTPNATTVYYSCVGLGHGQTSLTVETPRLARIDSQGVSGNEPFAFAYEARRAGECQAVAVARRR